MAFLQSDGCLFSVSLTTHVLSDLKNEFSRKHLKKEFEISVSDSGLWSLRDKWPLFFMHLLCILLWNSPTSDLQEQKENFFQEPSFLLSISQDPLFCFVFFMLKQWLKDAAVEYGILYLVTYLVLSGKDPTLVILCFDVLERHLVQSGPLQASALPTWHRIMKVS